MRTTSTSTTTALGQAVTQPIILVSIGFSTTLRYSSRGDIDWNGETWSGGRLAKGSAAIRPTKNGKEGVVTLANHDNAMTAIILTEGASTKEIKVWYLYGDAPFAVDDAVQVFDGQIDGVESMEDFVRLSVISDGMVQWTPRITCTFDRFSHMIRANTEITWAGEKFILTPDPEAF